MSKNVVVFIIYTFKRFKSDILYYSNMIDFHLRYFRRLKNTFTHINSTTYRQIDTRFVEGGGLCFHQSLRSAEHMMIVCVFNVPEVVK